MYFSKTSHCITDINKYNVVIRFLQFFLKLKKKISLAKRHESHAPAGKVRDTITESCSHCAPCCVFDDNLL